MTKLNAIGLELTTYVSEPWEFVSLNGAGPFIAKVLAAKTNEPGKEMLLLQLHKPLSYRDIDCEYFVATLRHEGANLESLLTGAVVTFALTRIPEDRATSTNSFDLSSWRGGVGLIGTLQRV